MTFHQTQHFSSPTQTSSFSTASTSLLSSTSPSAAAASSSGNNNYKQYFNSTNNRNNNNDRSNLRFDLFSEHEDYSETQFLKDSIANHTKYGSTAAIPTTHFQYVTHYVEPSDTLQGLALKYGCKIENIKKCNKLFSDDNNYLRSRFTLLMPIECQKNASSPLQSSSSSQESNSSLNGNIPLNSPPVTNNGQFVSLSKSPMKHSYSNQQFKTNAADKYNAAKKQNSLCETSTNNQDGVGGDESIADFLIRIDSSIAASKREASKIAKKVEQSIDIIDEYSQNRFHAPKPIEGQFFVASSSSSGSIFDDSKNSDKQKLKGKKAKYRYEKAHDEIFEL